MFTCRVCNRAISIRCSDWESARKINEGHRPILLGSVYTRLWSLGSAPFDPCHSRLRTVSKAGNWKSLSVDSKFRDVWDLNACSCLSISVYIPCLVSTGSASHDSDLKFSFVCRSEVICERFFWHGLNFKKTLGELFLILVSSTLSMKVSLKSGCVHTYSSTGE